MGMQTVLNKKERDQAFLRFLLFFVITSVLLVTAVYFNFSIPFSENRRLQGSLALQNEMEMKQRAFVSSLSEALVLIDSLDKTPAMKDNLDILIKGKITTLSKLQTRDGSQYAAMNDVLIQRLLELKEKKLQVINLSDRAGDLVTLREKLQMCNDELDRKSRELNAYSR